MVEDSFVDLIYGHIYGWKTLLYALITASLVLTTISAVSIYYAQTFLTQNLDLVREISGVILGLIGLYWLATSILWPDRESELEEARERQNQKTRLNFLVALQLVAIEELEILVILIPLVIASHVLEASLAATIGIIVSLSTAFLLRRSFEKRMEGKMRLLKIISGLFLIGLGIVLFIEV